MKILMSAQEAKKLVAGSDERKEELIGLMNGQIESQAQRGLRWAHFPNDAGDPEREWLGDELVLKGFTVAKTNPAITW